MFIPKIRSVPSFWRSAMNAKAATPTPVSNAIASRFPDLPPIRRPAGFAGTSTQPSDEAQNLEALRHYMNLDNARSILANIALRILPRDPAAPPRFSGLVAIAGYTGGFLGQRISAIVRTTGPAHKADAAEVDRLSRIKALIAQTVIQIRKTDVDVVRRNVLFDRDRLETYQVGLPVAFDQLTSVTCRSAQVYTGGNVDFVIRTRSGVVSIEPLSFYQADEGKRLHGEAEGLLELDSRYRVLKINEGKENGMPSLDEEIYPATTIFLEEI